MARYIPDRGDVLWVKFDPQAGAEIMKTRPAVIVSRFNFNRITRFALVCPITSEIKGHLFEVPIPRLPGHRGNSSRSGEKH